MNTSIIVMCVSHMLVIDQSIAGIATDVLIHLIIIANGWIIVLASEITELLLFWSHQCVSDRFGL